MLWTLLGLSGCGLPQPVAPAAKASSGLAQVEEPTPGANAGVPLAPLRPQPILDANMWLHTAGNRILRKDGSIWMGRGVGIHDTRSCNACTFSKPNVDLVLRDVDLVTDDWGANFVRVGLESYASPGERVHSASLLDDPAYLADIKTIVDAIGAHRGVYVLLSLWLDASFETNANIPTARTAQTWAKLAATFKDYPYVLFAVSSEPQFNENGARDEEIWQGMNNAVAAIRSVEREANTPNHIVVVQGTHSWARDVSFYVDRPITAGGGADIAYETHPYSPEFDPTWSWDRTFRIPAQRLPVIVGEFGPAFPSQGVDVQQSLRLVEVANELQLPYAAWTIHSRCGPASMFTYVANAGSICATSTPLVLNDWGKTFRDHLRSMRGR